MFPLALRPSLIHHPMVPHFPCSQEYLGTDAISDGRFRMGDYFLVEALDSAFDRDSRLTSHPLFFEIRKAEDVSEAFDSITYSKGASVLRMIQAVMGEQSFKQGLNVSRFGEGRGGRRMGMDGRAEGRMHARRSAQPPLPFRFTLTASNTKMRNIRTCGMR